MADLRRRKYWADFRSQTPFLLKMGGVWAVGMAILCLLLFYLSDEELGRSFFSVHMRIRNTWQILLPAVLISGGTSSLLIIGSTIFVALRESHRLGGPIFKFRRLFKELEEGYLDPDFHFRAGDVLYDLGESYRSALQANRERAILVQRLSRQAEATSVALQEELAKHPLAPEGTRLLEESAALAARLREASSAFRVGAA